MLDFNEAASAEAPPDAPSSDNFNELVQSAVAQQQSQQSPTKTASPKKRISSRVLDFQQNYNYAQQANTLLSQQSESNISSPLVKRKTSPALKKPQTVIAREFVNFNPTPGMKQSLNQSQISEATAANPIGQQRHPGVLTSIESHSQQAAQEPLFKGGGDIHNHHHIPGIGSGQGNSNHGVKPREDAFEMNSPGHRSSNSQVVNMSSNQISYGGGGSASYYNQQLENPQQTVYNRGASSAQGKQQVLMDTGAKVTGINGVGGQELFQTMISPQGNQVGGSQRMQGSSATGMIRVRNESLSSAGKVIGSAASTKHKHNAQMIGSQAKPFSIHEMHNGDQHQHNKSVHIPNNVIRNATNESIQSMQLPENITVASLNNSAAGVQPIRLKDMNRPRGLSSDQVASASTQGPQASLRSGQGPRNQAMSNLLGSGQSPGNMTQMMRASQYPGVSGPAGSQSNGPSGQAHSMSPVKARTSGLGGASFAPTVTNNSIGINTKKGSILSQASPQLKPGQNQHQSTVLGNQSNSQGFGLTQLVGTSSENVQQRQFQLQNANQILSSAQASGQQIQNQSHTAQMMSTKGMATAGGHQRIMTQGQQQFNGIAGHGTIYNNNQSTTSGRKQNQFGGAGQIQQQQFQQQQQSYAAAGNNQQLKNNQSQQQQLQSSNINQPQSALPSPNLVGHQQIMKPNEPGSLPGGVKPPTQQQQVINRNNPGQGQNSFRGGPMNKPSPLKSQGGGGPGIMGTRPGVGGLGVTPNSNLHHPGAPNSGGILGNQMGAQQQMNPLFKMGQGGGPLGQPSSGGPGGHLNPHHTGMGMQGQVIGNGQNNAAQANITGLSHPSTATHQNAATHEHLNSTVGSHNKTNDITKDGAGGHGQSNQVPGAAAGGLSNFGHGEGGFKMFERENFKFKDSIMIHVIDDSKNEKRDFTFSRSLLVKYMKYFDRCLKKISDNDEIDISIHCDAVIFEWLLNYIFAMEEYEKKQSEQEKFQRAVGNSVTPAWQKASKATGGDDNTEKDKNNFANSAIMQYGGPKLDIKNAVTILIPAEFLKIDRLVRECLDFIGEHIEEISRVQVDMSCINTNIIREMAKKVSLDRLDVLKERKDKIVSRLFMKKLELLLEKEKNHLYKCAYCNKLFTKKQRKVLSCRKGTSFIDSNGQMRAKHVIDKNWDLKKFVTFVRETYRISWKEIYWKVWSYLHLIKCERCTEFYPIAEMGYCRFHKQAAKIKMSATPLGSQYEYPCCDETVSVYQLLNSQKGDHGCQTQLHETRHIYNVAKNKEKKIIDRIIAHQLIILENPTQSVINAINLEEKQKNGQIKEGSGHAHTVKEATSGMTPTIVRPSSLNYKISLVEAVKNFISKERVGPDQIIEVELEETSSKKMAHFEVLDDALFNLQYVPKYGGGPKEKSVTVGSGMSKNKRDSAHRLETQWEREEEQIRRKLEKNSINLMKSKIAQQARAEQSSTANQQQQQQQQQADQDQQAQAAGQAHQGNTTGVVQLSQNQIEEAKQMTQGKLKMYRRDRLYTSDKDRLDNLHNSLKNVRIVDEAAFFNSLPEGSSGSSGSPSKVTRNHHRDGVPPMHKGGGKGDRGGPGGGSGAAGGYGGGYGGKGGGNLHAPEKGGSANANKGSDYSSSHNRGGGQHRANASGAPVAMMSATAQAMQDAIMFGATANATADNQSNRVIRGLSDITTDQQQKRLARLNGASASNTKPTSSKALTGYSGIQSAALQNTSNSQIKQKVLLSPLQGQHQPHLQNYNENLANNNNNAALSVNSNTLIMSSMRGLLSPEKNQPRFSAKNSKLVVSAGSAAAVLQQKQQQNQTDQNKILMVVNNNNNFRNGNSTTGAPLFI